MELMSKDLTPLQQVPTSEIVATQVRGLIASGEFAQGSTINETTLASALGVSRGPIREALQRLVQEGLVTNERNRKLRVPELTTADVRDIYRTREAIEVAALEAIMESGETRFSEESRAVIDQMAECTRLGDAAGIASADLDFHLLLIEMSGSQRLARAFATLTVETQMCLHELLMLDPSQGQSVAIHTAIVEAVEAQDLPAARTAMRRHNEVTLSLYLAHTEAESAS